LKVAEKMAEVELEKAGCEPMSDGREAACPPEEKSRPFIPRKHGQSHPEEESGRKDDQKDDKKHSKRHDSANPTAFQNSVLACI